MSIIDKLATSLGRRDEVPNVELAKKLAAKNDADAIKELVENLKNKNKNIQCDCIKVLYEAGELNPSLIGMYYKAFLELLDHKNNRMVWGAMHTLNCITNEKPKEIYASLVKIIKVADEGTVITRDHAVSILIKLGSYKPYQSNSFDLLLEQLKKAPTNQLPKYAEDSFHLINSENKVRFLKVLNSRLGDIDSDTKKKRVEKVIKKLDAAGA